MSDTRIVLKSGGAILLGNTVSCDGFSYDHKLRIQSHIHSDHMVGFDTSKANQTILMSNETKSLLFALRNADLPYRSNIISIACNTCFTYDGVTITLAPSHHMLGSVQVKVTDIDGYRIGYSSDFFWPIDDAIEVDELLVDATYGSPDSLRDYKQDRVDDRLLEIICSGLKAGRSIAVIGYHGRTEYAVHLLGSVVKVPIICSPKVFALIPVYAANGFSMPDIIRSDSPKGLEILRAHQPCVSFVSIQERRHLPWVDRLSKITLSAYMTQRNDPILSYGNGDYRIAFTDHADFDGTLRYVEKTGARHVWTDPRSGNAESLATEIRRQLGVECQMAQRLHDRGWG